MKFSIKDSEGQIQIGALSIVWGNALEDLPGFFCIGLGHRYVEFGDIDNGNGIYYTQYVDGEPTVNRALLKLS